MYTRLRENPQSTSANDLLGATIYGRDHEKLGTVDDLLLDADDNKIKYAIIDTGGWLKTRRFLVPADALRGAETDTGDFVFDDLDKARIETLPPLDEAALRSDRDFREYEQRYVTQWPMTPTAARIGSGRLARFEQSLRGGTHGTAASTSPRPGTTVAWGVYDDRKSLATAVGELKDSGFQREDISVLMPDKEASQRLSFKYDTKAPEGIAAGATTGALLGGSLGWLASIGAITIPVIGALLAAGPIVAALAGAGAAGAIGGLAGGLIGLGMPELEAKRYQTELAKGGVLLSVQCSDARFAETAKRILDRTGARDVLITGQLKAA
jgi:hypothetical protein